MLRQFKYAEDILLGSNTTGIHSGYQDQILSILKGKPFWIWDKEQHLKLARESIIGVSASGSEGGDFGSPPSCCFNHIVGLPVKDHIEHPIYDYEKILYDSLLSVDGEFQRQTSLG